MRSTPSIGHCTFAARYRGNAQDVISDNSVTGIEGIGTFSFTCDLTEGADDCASPLCDGEPCPCNARRLDVVSYHSDPESWPKLASSHY
jgi:hypothetical protein